MSEALPFFSIVIPLYNKEATVERALRSVLNQTVQDFEIIVINDGSTDDSARVVKAIGDHRIRLIHQKNQGVSAARNKGIAEARYGLIAFLDADDEWLPNFLETIIRLRKKFPICKVFGTQYFFCSHDGQQRQAIIRGLPAGFTEGILINYFDIASQSDPPLWTGAVSVEKKAIVDIGGFPVGIASGEDLLTWARLAIKFQIAYSKNPVAVHYNPQTVSDRPGRVPIMPDMVGNALKELLDTADHEIRFGIRAYLALWHRMRATIFIQCGNRSNALRELREAMRFAPSIRLIALFLIAILPACFSGRLLLAIKNWKNDL